MSKRKSKTNVDYGEFPFPLLEGPQESRFLTWIRNHSDYMASRGFLDYLRSVGVLVRGIVINFLIFLPWLLLISVLLAPCHHWMLAHPYYLTFWTLGIAALGIFLFMVLLPLLRVFNYRRSIEKGSESSIRWRDLCERSFGGGLLLIGAAVTLETLPWMLEFLRDVLDEERLNSGATLTALSGALVLLSSSGKILSRLGGLTRQLAKGLIGILGLLVPLFVILFVNDILVYGAPPSPWVMISPLVIPVAGVIVIIIAFSFGISRRAFSSRESTRVIGMLAGGLLLIGGAIYVGGTATFDNIEKTEESLERLVAPLDTVAKEFSNISAEKEIGAEVKALVDQFVSVQRKYGRAQEDFGSVAKEDFVSTQKEDPSIVAGTGAESPVTNDLDSNQDGEDGTELNESANLSDLMNLSKWEELDTTATGLSEQFAIGREFVILGSELSALPRGSLDSLRDEIAKLAHDRLAKKLESSGKDLTKLSGEFNEGTSAENNKSVSTKLRKQFERELIEGAVRKLVKDFGESYELTTANGESKGKMADDPNIDKVLQRYTALSTEPREALGYAPIYGEKLLQERTIEELSILAGKKKIEDIYSRNFNKKKDEANPGITSVEPGDPHWERKRELSKLTGIDEIAELVSKRDIIGEILSDLPSRVFLDKPIDEEIGQEIDNLKGKIATKRTTVQQLTTTVNSPPTEAQKEILQTAQKELEGLWTEDLKLQERKLELISFEDLARTSLVKLALPGEREGPEETGRLTPKERSRVANELMILASRKDWATEKYPDLVLEAEKDKSLLKEQTQIWEKEQKDGLAKLEMEAEKARGEEWAKVEKDENDKLELKLASLEKSDQSEAEKVKRRDQLKTETEETIALRKVQAQEKVDDDFDKATKEWKIYIEERSVNLDEFLKEYTIHLDQISEAKLKERQKVVALIPRVARMELADLILEELDTNFLGVLALHPDLYRGTFDDLAGTCRMFDYQLDRAEFDSRKRIAGLATKPTLEKLVKHAFTDSNTKGTVAGSASNQNTGGSSFADVTKILLAQRAIEDAEFDFDIGELDIKDDNERRELEASLRGSSIEKLGTLARRKLVERALHFDPLSKPESDRARGAREVLGKLSDFERSMNARKFSDSELTRIAVTRFTEPSSDRSDDLISTMMFGRFGPLERETLGSVKAELSGYVMWPKVIFFAVLALAIGLIGWFTIDVNLTSIHGLYRDRLASAFLVGEDKKGDVNIEEDVDLEEICRHEARSIAPYHLVNVALNLQGSDDPGIRDRNSDFFIFSKKFIGSERTGYCRSETMERVFPQMSLSTAMAISAAAASPNMGRGTSRLTVAFMTLLNIRMGFWIPNPGLLEERKFNSDWISRYKKSRIEKFEMQAKMNGPFPECHDVAEQEEGALGFKFNEVFARELEDIEKRWCRIDPAGVARNRDKESPGPTVKHGLVGIAFSGGGIRSAAINLGIAQALHKCGVFGHVDYMSTVSGGGYLGSSISALMRTRTKLESEIAGTVHVESEERLSEIDGIVKIEREACTGDQIVTVASEKSQKEKVHRFSPDAQLTVSDGDLVAKATPLVHFRDIEAENELESPTAERDAAEEKAFEQITGDQVVMIKPTGRGEAKSYWFSPDAQLDVKDDVKAGKQLLRPRGAENVSEISGSVAVSQMPDAPWEQIVTVNGTGVDGQKSVVYRFSRFEKLMVETGEMVTAGQALIDPYNTLGARFQWRVRPTALLREITTRLDEKSRWVNLSDGGHLENLATIELLRRRCKFIIIGDGEADLKLNFNGLATLIRTAQIDLGIEIKINLDAVRLKKAAKDDLVRTVSAAHWAVGTIRYPRMVKKGETEKEGLAEEVGHLLYLKSSFTGDETEVVQEYRRRNPNFPHQTTSDQSFDEGQFEAYRSLGEHIASSALDPAAKPGDDPNLCNIAYGELESWFDQLTSAQKEWRESKRKRRKKQPDAQSPRKDTADDKTTDNEKVDDKKADD